MVKKGRKAKRKPKGGDTGSAAPARGEAPSTSAAAAPATVATSREGAAHRSDGARGGPGRAFSNAFIALFLAYQVLMPLRYYLTGGGYDERFSWRMFSTLRMQRCQVRLDEQVGPADGESMRSVNLERNLQVAWIGMLKRYRRSVVDKVLTRRCARPDVRKVRYERRCIDTDGSALPTKVVMMRCATREIDVRDSAAGSAR